MDEPGVVSMESVILFFGILFLVFCCGTVRAIRQHFRKPLVPRVPPRNILVTHIRLPSQMEDRNEGDLSGVYPAEEQISPPPYSALPNVLPPSYDEAVRQNTNSDSNSSNQRSSVQKV